MCNFARILHALTANNGLQVHYGRLDTPTEGELNMKRLLGLLLIHSRTATTVLSPKA